MNLKFWLENPQLIHHRIRYWIWEKLNSDKPWLCPGTIRFCEKHFAGSQQGLEFGSGRSTSWFAKLAARLTSVEHSADWHRDVEKQLAKDGISNVDYRLVPLEHPLEEPEHDVYDPVPAYVRVADSFSDGEIDFAIVDGHYRSNCIRRSIPKLRPGGYLVVDDVNMWPSRDALPVPKHWPVVDDSSNGLKRCLIWQAKQLH